MRSNRLELRPLAQFALIPHTWFMLALIWFVLRRDRSHSAFVLFSIPLLTNCGGQTELVAIEQSSGGTSSSAASTGGSGALSAGGSSVISQSDSGVSCPLPASDLDYSCSVDSDCVAVPAGDPCSPNCYASCLVGAVNAGVAAKYTSDFSIPNGGKWRTMDCFCACTPFAPCCKQGRCYNSCGMCSGPAK